jgi:hypothetical protein
LLLLVAALAVVGWAQEAGVALGGETILPLLRALLILFSLAQARTGQPPSLLTPDRAAISVTHLLFPAVAVLGLLLWRAGPTPAKVAATAAKVITTSEPGVLGAIQVLAARVEALLAEARAQVEAAAAVVVVVYATYHTPAAAPHVVPISKFLLTPPLAAAASAS